MVMLMVMVMVVATWWTRQQLTLTAKQVQKSTCRLGRRQLRASTLQVGQAANNIAISRVEPPLNVLLLLLGNISIIYFLESEENWQKVNRRLTKADNRRCSARVEA